MVHHIQTVVSRPDVAVACIYCDYKEQTRQTVPELVASLLKQLMQDRPETSDNVISLYERHLVNNTRPTQEELTQALRSEIGLYSKVFVVVDALDECLEGNQRRLITELRSLGDTVSMLVTSRRLALIEELFLSAKRLDIYATNEDVQKYVEGRIAQEPRLARVVGTDPALRETVVKQITGNVEGMYVFLLSSVCPFFDILHRFLLAELHMDSLSTRSNRRDIRIALDRLPAEVNATYDLVMERIAGQSEGDRTLAEQLLSWVAYACRPLSIRELQHASAVSPDMTDIDPDAIIDELTLTSVCAGLVVIDEHSNTIRLVRK